MFESIVSPVRARRRFVKSKSGNSSPGVTFVNAMVSIPVAMSYFAVESSSSITLPGRVSLHSQHMGVGAG